MPAPSFGRVFVLPLVLAVVGLGLLALVLRTDAAPDRSNPEAQARARQHAVQLAAQTVALGAARTALLKTTAKTLVFSNRYIAIRDSVFVPVTKAETVAVLANLPMLLAASDSMHRACTELSETCAVFRTRAESSIAGLTVDRDLWKGIAESEKPSKWAPVREWAIRIGIGYGAFKLGQAAVK